MLNVYELQWGGPYIYDEIGDGLWDNNGKISIHIPFLQESFKIINNNIIEEYKETKMEKFSENFYIKYNNNDYVERMNFSYFALNDLVFNNKVYNGLKKNKFYISLKNN